MIAHVKKLDRALKSFAESLFDGMGRPERRRAMAWYLEGLLLDGSRKNIEPMASRLVDEASGIEAMRQRLQQCVSISDWSVDEVRARLAHKVEDELPGIEALVLDDTGFSKQGKHSVSVARQYSGTLGRTDNCQVAVSLHLAGELGSSCLGMQLYLPEEWTSDSERCRAAGVPEDVGFLRKWEIALRLLDDADRWGVAKRLLLVDAGYGEITAFRQAITERGYPYIVGMGGDPVVWMPGTAPPAPRRGSRHSWDQVSVEDITLSFWLATLRSDDHRPGRTAAPSTTRERTFMDAPFTRPDTRSPCFACGYTGDALDHHEFRVREYSYFRCQNCLSLACRPLPDDEALSKAYSSFGERYTAGMSRKRYEIEMPKRFRARLGLIRRFSQARTLVDVGGGDGLFSTVAQDEGFTVHVYDYIRQPRNLGHTVIHPCNVSESGGLPIANDSADIVTFWSCLEHVRSPQVSLRELLRITRPGGIIAMDTPLVGDLCERLYPARSHWVFPPQHLHLFSEKGLREVFEKMGASVLLHAPFFERNAARWIARRGRNLLVASVGGLRRLLAPMQWKWNRSQTETTAGDIQVLIARKT